MFNYNIIAQNVAIFSTSLLAMGFLVFARFYHKEIKVIFKWLLLVLLDNLGTSVLYFVLLIRSEILNIEETSWICRGLDYILYGILLFLWLSFLMESCGRWKSEFRGLFLVGGKIASIVVTAAFFCFSTFYMSTKYFITNQALVPFYHGVEIGYAVVAFFTCLYGLYSYNWYLPNRKVNPWIMTATFFITTFFIYQSVNAVSNVGTVRDSSAWANNFSGWFLVCFNLSLFLFLWDQLQILVNSKKETTIDVYETVIEKYKLSNREGEILRLMGEGKTNAEIADLLFISINTVKTHVKNVYGKLSVSSRVQLMQFLKNKGNK